MGSEPSESPNWRSIIHLANCPSRNSPTDSSDESFSEISKNWAGEPLDSYQKVLNFIRFTRTQTGLSVTAHLDRRYYATGTEPTPEQLQSLRLKPHEILPKWNYTISPNL